MYYIHENPPFIPVIVLPGAKFDEYVIDEIIETMALYSPPIYVAPLFRSIREAYLDGLVKRGFMEKVGDDRYVLVDPGKYRARKIDVDVIEYRMAIHVLRRVGAEYSAMLSPGLVYLLRRVIWRGGRGLSIDKIAYIAAKIANSLSDIGYNTVIFYDEPTGSDLEHREIHLGVLCEAYNKLINILNTRLNGIIFCEAPSPITIAALTDTRLDFIVFNPLQYTRKELEELAEYIRESKAAKPLVLEVIDLGRPLGEYYQGIYRSLSTLSGNIMALSNTCSSWSSLVDDPGASVSRLYEEYNNLISLLNELRKTRRLK